MAANTNVVRQTDITARPLIEFNTFIGGLAAADINSGFLLFFVDRDLAIDKCTVGYQTAAGTSSHVIDIAYAATPDVAKGSRTKVLEDIPVGDDNDHSQEASHPNGKAAVIPANNWVFVQTDDTLASLAGCSIAFQGRLGVRA